MIGDRDDCPREFQNMGLVWSPGLVSMMDANYIFPPLNFFLLSRGALSAHTDDQASDLITTSYVAIA